MQGSSPQPPAGGSSGARSEVTGAELALRSTSLREGDSIPVGSQVDTRTGVVELTSAADGSGHTQTARFKYGLFQITQSAKKGAYTELKLVGPLECGGARAAGSAVAASPIATSSKGRGRRLWGSGHGRFRTSGRKGSGAGRGTTWQVTDLCNKKTLIQSLGGRVTARDFVRKRTVILKTGQRYVAPGKKAKRRKKK